LKEIFDADNKTTIALDVVGVSGNDDAISNVLSFMKFSGKPFFACVERFEFVFIMFFK
jgi:hypothetical protein